MDKIRQNANLITQVAKTESNESTRHEERSRLKNHVDIELSNG